MSILGEILVLSQKSQMKADMSENLDFETSSLPQDVETVLRRSLETAQRPLPRRLSSMASSACGQNCSRDCREEPPGRGVGQGGERLRVSGEDLCCRPINHMFLGSLGGIRLVVLLV